MIKLKSDNNKLNCKQISDDFFNGEKGGPKDPFQLRDVEEFKLDDTNDENDLDLIIKYISRLDSKANISQFEEFYEIAVEFKDLDENILDDFNISIKPLLSNKTSDFSQRVNFNKLNILSLSEFFVVIIEDNLNNVITRVIKIPATGMPNDRQKKVISNIITDENAFIKYVAFLLGDEFVLTIDTNFIGKEGNSINMQLPELYEKMLKATVYSPEKFKELEFLINALSDDNVVPEGFEEMYNTFLVVLD